MHLTSRKSLGLIAAAGFFTALLPVGARAAAAAPEESASPVTFSKDVAPILQKHCQACHRPGQMAPMSLQTYEETRPWVRSIRQRVSNREMPPWHIDRTVGIREYLNDPSLSDEQIATIVKWIDSGAPKGNPADMPPPVQWASDSDWNIGKPDLIVTMDKEFVVPASGADIYVNMFGKTGLTEDRYIKAIEVHPSPAGRRVVHHVNTFALQSEEGGGGGKGIAGGGGAVALPGEVWLKEAAVGNAGDVFPDDTGRLIKAGAGIRFNIHYHTVGEEIRDRVSIAFKFYPKGYVPKRQILSKFISNSNLDIPAGEANARHDSYWILPQPAEIVHFRAHMHYRGKLMQLEAILPDGTRQLLTSVPRYDFGWQLTYSYKVPPVFPKGTVIHMTSIHDNSPGNRHNPDPTMWTGSGERTVDEMAVAHTDWIFLTEAEYQEIAAERKKNLSTQN